MARRIKPRSPPPEKENPGAGATATGAKGNKMRSATRKNSYTSLPARSISSYTLTADLVVVSLVFIERQA
jgi:hypothetical protein